jgi:hypothetical protein
MDIITKYIKITGNNHDKSNFIKICFRYDLGGYNYFTYEVKPRGYYLTVYPVERGRGMEGFTAFSGVSECIHECSRKSAKAQEIAAEKIPVYEKMMVDHIVNKYGYTIEV